MHRIFLARTLRFTTEKCHYAKQLSAPFKLFLMLRAPLELSRRQERSPVVFAFQGRIKMNMGNLIANHAPQVSIKWMLVKRHASPAQQAASAPQQASPLLTASARQAPSQPRARHRSPARRAPQDRCSRCQASAAA